MIRYLVLIAALLMSPVACSAQTLVQGGHAAGRIYLTPSEASLKKGAVDPLDTAAQELNYHLKKMSGASLEIVRTADPAAVKGPGIVLGDLAVRMGAVPQKASPSKEGFRLLTRNGLVLIGGESDAGTLFGAYAFLEKLGVDWVMPGQIGEIIPERSTVPVPALDESQAPDFQMRRLWYRGGSNIVSKDDRLRMAQWSRRQKGGDFEPVAAEVAGHYWPAFIKKHQAEFDKDPTLYALRPDATGELVRQGPQIETTHPRVIAMMAQDIRDTFAKKGWPKDKAAGFPIGPADTLAFSVSPASVAAGSGRTDPVNGAPDETDLMVKLGNDVLAALGPEYPNAYVGFYSYSVYAGYPARQMPNPRIAIIFAPINYSRYHSMLDAGSRTQPLYKQVFDQWAALSRRQGNPLLYRGYNWNLAENMLPYSKLRIWGEELPYYRQAGVSGLNVEATKAWGVNGPSDWLFMKLAWNADQDWRKLLADYCAKSFGAGAEPMQRYFLRLTERQQAAGQEAGSYHAIALIYDHAFVAAARADLAEAARLARRPDEKTRIGYFAPSVELLDHYLSYVEAANRHDFAAAKTQYDAMLATWGEAYRQNPDIAAREGPQYLERFIGPFVRDALRYSSGDYRLVQPLPDQLKTAFRGENLQAPSLDDAGWRLTKTYSSTFDAQRLDPREPVWYRHHFTLPAGVKGQSVGLFLGGFNDEAIVWLNGKKIGASGRRFSRPAVFDLTPALNATGDNVLAVQVVRNHAVNEIGVGGLFRPSFIFTGPPVVGARD